jgi:HD-GYP domain-containing protein (c-di-GMP phosphodiesterase class II)
VEVLSRYLQGGTLVPEARSDRVAKLAAQVAMEMHLPSRDVDHIRVAALLRDLEHVEITTRVIRKALGTLEAEENEAQRTFHGADLVQSLGEVLVGAMPLLVDQADLGMTQEGRTAASPLGGKIIRTVQAYDDLTQGTADSAGYSHQRALEYLRSDRAAKPDEEVLDALNRALSKTSQRTAEDRLEKFLCSET